MKEFELKEWASKWERQSRGLSQRAALWVLTLALPLTLGQIGCGSGQPRQASTPSPTPIIEQPYQRFLPIAHGQGFLSFPYWAFDTKTGQLCKTWEWQDMSAASKSAQTTGDSSKLKGLDAAAIGTPTCKELWEESKQASAESFGEWLKQYRAQKRKENGPLGILSPPTTRKVK